MDVTTIICIIVAFVLGAVIVYFTKRGGISQEEVDAKIKKETIKLTTQLAQKDKELQTKTGESEGKIAELKNKLDASTKDYSAQITALKSQLENSMNGELDDVIKDQLENAKKSAQEVDKLKKKISKLEEDLEDAEDDLSSEKKKVKAKEAENVQLLDEISKKKKEVSQLTEDLETTKQQLADKLEELNLKMDSLKFVQEILTAKQTSDASVQERYASVERISDYVSNELWDVFKQVNNNALDTPEFNDRFEHWSASARKNWLDGKTTIAFVGEFSAGKTSIVNRILSQDDPNVPKLPVSTKATTAIPTYISGTPYATTYNFLSKDNVLKNISEETFKMVSKEVLDQVGGVSSLIENFVMKYKNPNLEKMSILDTPGFNSNDPEDARHTLDVINECDALFWVFDVNAGTVNRSSIDLIRKNLKKPLYVVINKVDTKSSSEVDKVEALIKGTLSKEGIKVEKFIRFSAKAPLSDIMNAINSVPRDNNQVGFLDYLLQIVSKAHNEKKNAMSNANRRYQSMENTGTQIVNQYNQAQNQLWNECNEAYNLPKWTEHLFSKDRFEMNQYEGNRLRSLLEDIANAKMNQLAELFNRRVENAQEAQHAYEEVNSFKAQVDMLLRAEQQLKKLISDFNSEKKSNSSIATSEKARQ